MTNLVYRLLLFPGQFTILVDRLCLQKVTYLVARIQEVVVTDVIVFSGGELCLEKTETSGQR